VTEHPYTCAWGTGRFLLAGDLPVELWLPEAGAPAAAEAAAAAASTPAADALRDQLERYFAGEPVTFALDVDAHAEAHGLTAFERDVFAALAAVPYGTPVSYRELAAAAGRPNAYRATGSVMARNALPLILPCHRVVRNDGRLGQYGTDPAWKERLLALEGVAVREGRLS
jgi:methylated-DNA-[protein]-cysteine S-methyltransferase